MAEWRTEYTGCFPNLCSGYWHLYKDDEEVFCPFNNSCCGEPAYTHGTYWSWYFEDWIEEWEEYEDGLTCGEWCGKHWEWLKSIEPDIAQWSKIYKAFQVNDWRHNSCGGCI